MTNYRLLDDLVLDFIIYFSQTSGGIELASKTRKENQVENCPIHHDYFWNDFSK